MPYVSYSTLEITADGSGNGQVFTSEITGGVVCAVNLDAATASGADFNILTEDGRVPIWQEENVASLSTKKVPLAKATTNGGVVLEWSTGIPILVPIPVSDERIEINISGATPGTYFRFDIIVLDDADTQAAI